jgi:hypothetical protein
MGEREPTPQDPAYRAIGRFVVEFSQLIYDMQNGTATVVGAAGAGENVGRALQVAIGSESG